MTLRCGQRVLVEMIAARARTPPRWLDIPLRVEEFRHCSARAEQTRQRSAPAEQTPRVRWSELRDAGGDGVYVRATESTSELVSADRATDSACRESRYATSDSAQCSK